MLGIPLVLSVLLLIFTAFSRWRSKDEDPKKAEEFPRVQQFVHSQESARPLPTVDSVSAYAFEEFSSTPASTGRHQCAACLSTASTRCSRCKAVRYCSSKCQILHWRQGHKYECHPQVPSEFEREGLSGKAEAMEQSETSGIDSADGLPRMNSKGAVNQTHFDSSDSHIMTPRLSTVTIDSLDSTARPNSPGESVELDTDVKSRNVVLEEDLSNTLNENASLKSPDVDRSEEKLNKQKLKRTGRTKPRASNLPPGLKKYNSSERTVSGDLHHSKPKQVPDAKHSHSIKHGEDKEWANKQADSSLSLPRSGGSSSYLVHNGIKSSLQKVMHHIKSSNQKKSPPTNALVETLGNHDCKAVFKHDTFLRLYYSNEVELKPFGLINCGNSCYANAVLQCLTYTRPLTLYFLQGLHSKECWKEEWCFICEFEHLILKGREGNTPLSPVRILSKITHLGHGRQEDVHEFLRYAVDTMQSICIEQARFAGPVAEDTTLIGMTFGGYLHSKIKCMKCQCKSEKYERMMDLTVEIDGDIRTLEQALKRFTASEILEGENKYYCSRCKAYVKAKKKLTVFQAPNILTIVLKRFKAGNFTKLNKPVRFPEILNMTPYMSDLNDRFPQYSLYAVVVHLDVVDAAVSGHYVCYVKNYLEEWFKIDDSVVISADLERVLSEEAYMLLYARHSPRPPTSISNTFDKGGQTNLESVPRRSSGKSAIPKARYYNSDVNADPLAMQRQSSRNDLVKNPSYLEEWVSQSVESIPLMDSSSEASSLFSFSEEGTCSTPSTKDSASLEDFSDYIFGKGH